MAKGWNWRTKERFPNGELLTPQEDVTEDPGRIFTPVFSVVLVAIILANIVWWGSTWTPPEGEDSHSEAHAEDQSKAEVLAAAKSLGITNADIKGPWSVEDGVIGSEKCYAGGCSWLYGISKGANKTDSLMVIDDTIPNGIGAYIYGFGCNQNWTLRDGNGFVWPAAFFETNCNLKGHQTGTKAPWSEPRILWSRPSYHPQ